MVSDDARSAVRRHSDSLDGRLLVSTQLSARSSARIRCWARSSVGQRLWRFSDNRFCLRLTWEGGTILSSFLLIMLMAACQTHVSIKVGERRQSTNQDRKDRQCYFSMSRRRDIDLGDTCQPSAFCDAGGTSCQYARACKFAGLGRLRPFLAASGFSARARG